MKQERTLQPKKNIREIWQFIFCLITHLLVTQLAMRSLRQEFMLKIVWKQEIFSWISNSWSQQYHNTIFKHSKISHHNTIKWCGQTWYYILHSFSVFIFPEALNLSSWCRMFSIHISDSVLFDHNFLKSHVFKRTDSNQVEDNVLKVKNCCYLHYTAIKSQYTYAEIYV